MKGGVIIGRPDGVLNERGEKETKELGPKEFFL